MVVEVDGRRIAVSAVRRAADRQPILKTVGSSDQIREVTVDGHAGLWFAGVPHDVMYDAPIGEVVVERVAVDTLVWHDGAVLWRVEGFDRLPDAIEFVEEPDRPRGVGPVWHDIPPTDPHVVETVVPLVTLGLFGFGRAASAGGWAVGSLDAVPAATAGQTSAVGFTVLQHGVTPADLSEDVGIEIVNADGTALFFPATNDGVPGTTSPR